MDDVSADEPTTTVDKPTASATVVAGKNKGKRKIIVPSLSNQLDPAKKQAAEEEKARRNAKGRAVAKAKLKNPYDKKSKRDKTVNNKMAAACAVAKTKLNSNKKRKKKTSKSRERINK